MNAITVDGRFLFQARGIWETMNCKLIEVTANGSRKKHAAFKLRGLAQETLVAVSPTGNGVLIGTDTELILFGHNGQRLNTVAAPPGWRFASGSLDPSGTLATLSLYQSNKWLPPYERPVCNRRAKFFVPTGSCVGGSESLNVSGVWRQNLGEDCRFEIKPTIWLHRMLHWSPKIGHRQAAEVAHTLDRLEHGPREGAEAKLVSLGLSTREAFRMELATAKPSTALRRVHQQIRSRLFGHESPQRDLDLLVALCHHPDRLLAAGATARLRHILPQQVPPTTAGVRDNRATLKWNESSQHFENRRRRP